jgi:hypothetical protein
MLALILLHANPETVGIGSTARRFVCPVSTWPPPARVLGREFHKELVGTYELLDATAGGDVFIARYVLRIDDDYQRLTNRKARLHE